MRPIYIINVIEDVCNLKWYPTDILTEPCLVKIFVTQILGVPFSKIVSEYDQKIPQLQTADNPVAPREELLNHHETPGRQFKQSNQLSLPHQDDCNTRTDTKQRTTKHRTIPDSTLTVSPLTTTPIRLCQSLTPHPKFGIQKP